ncbi:MAG: OmpA family protein [Pseudomonadota bacterium]
MGGMSRAAALAAVGLALGGCTTITDWRGRVRTPNPCRDLTVSIYFERDSAALTREARAVLRGAGDRARGCRLGEVDVLGLADAVGDPGVNMALSERRAEAVRGAVTRMGFATVNFRVGAVGEDGAMTPQGAEPLRRRADVTFHLARPD